MILVSEIDKHWSLAKKLLSPAFCRIFHLDDLEDYYQSLCNGETQLWIVDDKGAVITSVDQGRNGRVLSVRFLGGKDLKSWASDMEETLTKFAIANNCKQIEAVTRKGFSRLIKTFKPQGLELFIKVV